MTTAETPTTAAAIAPETNAITPEVPAQGFTDAIVDPAPAATVEQQQPQQVTEPPVPTETVETKQPQGVKIDPPVNPTAPKFCITEFRNKLEANAQAASQDSVSIAHIMAQLIQEPEVTSFLQSKGVDIFKTLKALEVEATLEQDTAMNVAVVESEKNNATVQTVYMNHQFKEAQKDLMVTAAYNKGKAEVTALELFEDLMARIDGPNGWEQNPKAFEKAGITLEGMFPETFQAKKVERDEERRKYTDEYNQDLTKSFVAALDERDARKAQAEQATKEQVAEAVATQPTAGKHTQAQVERTAIAALTPTQTQLQ